MSKDQTYLGDGVYASFDGYQIWLRIEREGVPESIALEEQVLVALDRYVQSVRDKYDAPNWAK